MIETVVVRRTALTDSADGTRGANRRGQKTARHLRYTFKIRCQINPTLLFYESHPLNICYHKTKSVMTSDPPGSDSTVV